MTPGCLLCSPPLSGAAFRSPSVTMGPPSIPTGLFHPVNRLHSPCTKLWDIACGFCHTRNARVCVCACVPSSEYVGRTKVLAWGTGCPQLHRITQAHCLSQLAWAADAGFLPHSASQLARLPGWKAGYFVFCLETPIPEKSPGSSAHPGTCGKHHLYSCTWYPCEERENQGKHCASWDAASKICQLEMELSNSTHLFFLLSLISTRQLTTYLHSVYIVWYQESSRGHKTYRSPGDKAW